VMMRCDHGVGNRSDQARKAALCVLHLWAVVAAVDSTVPVRAGSRAIMEAAGLAGCSSSTTACMRG
jgi:hypothetical protein